MKFLSRVAVVPPDGCGVTFHTHADDARRMVLRGQARRENKREIRLLISVAEYKTETEPIARNPFAPRARRYDSSTGDAGRQAYPMATRTLHIRIGQSEAGLR